MSNMEDHLKRRASTVAAALLPVIVSRLNDVDLDDAQDRALAEDLLARSIAEAIHGLFLTSETLNARFPDTVDGENARLLLAALGEMIRDMAKANAPMIEVYARAWRMAEVIERVARPPYSEG